MPKLQILPTRVPPGIAHSVGRRVAATGITANMISVVGFFGSATAGWLVGQELLVAAGLVFLFFALLDLVDGAVARATGTASPYGAVLDAVLDRSGEVALLAGCAWYFAGRGEDVQVGLVFAALLGSVSVSYMRARAEVYGVSIRDGLFRRQERVGVLTIGLLFNWLTAAMWILAVLSNLTAAQRFWTLARALVDADAEELVEPG